VETCTRKIVVGSRNAQGYCVVKYVAQLYVTVGPVLTLTTVLVDIPCRPDLTFANMYLVRTITDEFSSPPRDNTQEITFRVFQDRQKMDLFISGHRSRNYGTYYDHQDHDLSEGQAWVVSAGNNLGECSCAPFIAVAPRQGCATCWHSACWGDCTHCSLCTDLTDAQQRYLKIVTELKTAEDSAQKVRLRDDFARLRQADASYLFYLSTDLRKALDAVSKQCQGGNDEELLAAVNTLYAILS